jgi:hypothetical protein
MLLGFGLIAHFKKSSRIWKLTHRCQQLTRGPQDFNESAGFQLSGINDTNTCYILFLFNYSQSAVSYISFPSPWHYNVKHFLCFCCVLKFLSFTLSLVCNIFPFLYLAQRCHIFPFLALAFAVSFVSFSSRGLCRVLCFLSFTLTLSCHVSFSSP